jgi:hypothetical protein
LNAPWVWIIEPNSPPLQDPIGTPSYCYWSFDAGGGNYNVFALAQQGSSASDLSYPQELLTNDIFGTLSVSVTAFLNGQNGWSLPTSQYKF